MPATTENAKPVFVFDGDCGFCRYWIQRWFARNKRELRIEPYQKVASEFPSIPHHAFERSVVYIAPDGTPYYGAEAVFRALAYAHDQKKYLKMYQKLPGFSWLAERSYRLVANHRRFFSKVTRFLSKS